MCGLVVGDLLEAAAHPLRVTGLDEVAGLVLRQTTAEQCGFEVLQVEGELQQTLVCMQQSISWRAMSPAERDAGARTTEGGHGRDSSRGANQGKKNSPGKHRVGRMNEEDEV